MRIPTRKVSYPEHLKRPTYNNWNLQTIRVYEAMVRKQCAQKDVPELAATLIKEAADKREARLRGVQEGLLEELFLHYRISPDAQDGWELLAKALALDHVPAFQFAHQRPRGRGAPKKRTRAASRDLVSAVDGVRVEIAAKRNCQVDAVSLRDAINGLLKRKPNEWTGRQGKRLSLKSMETRYYQMRRRASAPIYDPFPAHK